MLALFFGAAAFLYSMAGHGGASAFIALGLLAGLAPEEVRSNALLLNLAVAGMAALAFWRAGRLDYAKLLPLVLGSMPMAFAGARQSAASPHLKYGLGLGMLWAAWRFSFGADSRLEREERRQPSFALLLLTGMVLGWIAGWTGVGGGIYLTPLLLWMGWANTKDAAALAACFIWLNSLAGLLGAGVLPRPQPEWLAACVIGGALGAALGAFKLTPPALRRVLGLVLLLAAIKALGA